MKTSSMLWREDLDALVDKLEEIEEKERQDEMSVNKKTSKALVCKNKLIVIITTVVIFYIRRHACLLLM